MTFLVILSILTVWSFAGMFTFIGLLADPMTLRKMSNRNFKILITFCGPIVWAIVGISNMN